MTQTADLAPAIEITDAERAMSIYSFIASGGDNEFLSFTTIPGDPWSKSRPRFSGKHVYAKPEDADAEIRTGYHLKRLQRQPLTGNVALGCVFFRSNRQRIDADNLIKHICDAANGVLWLDDSQVTCVFGQVELDSTNPRTLVVIGRHASTLVRGTDAVKDCAYCGREFAIKPGRPALKQPYCSARCARTAVSGTDLSAPVQCPACKQPFRRFTSAQRFCSQPCSYTEKRLPRVKTAAPRPCKDCGVQMPGKGVRCRACWYMARSKGLA